CRDRQRAHRGRRRRLFLVGRRSGRRRSLVLASALQRRPGDLVPADPGAQLGFALRPDAGAARPAGAAGGAARPAGRPRSDRLRLARSERRPAGLLAMSELALVNAQVYRPSNGNAPATAVLVRDGRIAALGSDGEVWSVAGPRAEVLDLHGGTLLPGFTESH